MLYFVEPWNYVCQLYTNALIRNDKGMFMCAGRNLGILLASEEISREDVEAMSYSLALQLQEYAAEFIKKDKSLEQKMKVREVDAPCFHAGKIFRSGAEEHLSKYPVDGRELASVYKAVQRVGEWADRVSLAAAGYHVEIREEKLVG